MLLRVVNFCILLGLMIFWNFPRIKWRNITKTPKSLTQNENEKKKKRQKRLNVLIGLFDFEKSLIQ